MSDRASEAMGEPIEDGEEVDGLPVLAEPRAVEKSRRVLGPVAAQAAVVAATGFVAGAAAVAVVHHRRARRPAPRRRRPAAGKRAGELVQVVASRSFMVDVHLLGRE